MYSSKKIAIFLPSLSGGGAEKMMVNLANSFSKKGISVDLVLANAEGPYQSEVSSNVRIINLCSRRMITSLPKLIKYLNVEKPSSLLVTLESANIIAMLAKVLSRTKTKVVVRVPNNLSEHTKNSSKKINKIFPYLVRKLYPYADGIIAISKGVAQDTSNITGIPTSEIKVIYNPVVNNQLINKSNEPVDHIWLPSTSGIPVLVAVGRLTTQKDFGTLIRAFNIVLKDRPAKLLIIGEGTEKDNLEGLINDLSLQDDVHLIGFVKNPYKYMKKSSLFVLTSRWEGFGNVIVEAMACGTPIVSTNCLSGPSEILSNGRYGTLVEVGNAEEIAESIINTLDAPLDKEILINRAKEFSVDSIQNEYLDLLL